MKYYILITLILTSACSLYSGNTLTLYVKKPTNVVEPIEQIKEELTCHLQSINIETVSTRTELKKHVENILNKEILNQDQFPVFNAYINKYEFIQNQSVRINLGNALCDTALEFIKQKSKQLPDDPDSINFNCWPCGSLLAAYFNIDDTHNHEYDV